MVNEGLTKGRPIQIPDHSGIMITTGDKTDLGWGEGDAVDIVMAGESAGERLGIQVPEKDLLLADCGKEMAIGREDHRLDPGLGARGKFKTVGEFPGCTSIPELDDFYCIFTAEIRYIHKPLTIG